MNGHFREWQRMACAILVSSFALCRDCFQLTALIHWYKEQCLSNIWQAGFLLLLFYPYKMPHLLTPSPCEIREIWIISPCFDRLVAGAFICVSQSGCFYYTDNLPANSVDFVLLCFSETDLSSASVWQWRDQQVSSMSPWVNVEYWKKKNQPWIGTCSLCCTGWACLLLWNAIVVNASYFFWIEEALPLLPDGDQDLPWEILAVENHFNVARCDTASGNVERISPLGM